MSDRIGTNLRKGFETMTSESGAEYGAADLTAQPAAMAEELVGFLGRFERTVTGFSAGVDSSVVAVAAARALGPQGVAVTACTETITPADLEAARRIAAEFGIQHIEVSYSELEIEGYAENPSNRCYFCKDALYEHLRRAGQSLGGAAILDGTNADDLSDYRPGRQAAEEHGVISPLKELGFTKRDVRAIASWFGLENADRPSGPCLSSRVPYGTTITAAILRQIAGAEEDLRELGFTEFRVRHHGDVARLEILRDEFGRALELAESIEERLRARGYTWVSLDLGGFRSGSLNRVLTHIELPSTV